MGLRLDSFEWEQPISNHNECHEKEQVMDLDEQ